MLTSSAASAARLSRRLEGEADADAEALGDADSLSLDDGYSSSE